MSRYKEEAYHLKRLVGGSKKGQSHTKPNSNAKFQNTCIPLTAVKARWVLIKSLNT